MAVLANGQSSSKLDPVIAGSPSVHDGISDRALSDKTVGERLGSSVNLRSQVADRRSRVRGQAVAVFFSGIGASMTADRRAISSIRIVAPGDARLSVRRVMPITRRVSSSGIGNNVTMPEASS